MNLPLKPLTPLIGVVSRLAGQKGFDIILGSLAEILALDVQFVCLGTGDAGYEAALKKWSHDVPEKLACYIGYDEDLAHLIEAGADIFLMPSQYEPCGLNQMYSLMYGTVPVVRAVGGLADSVIDASESNLANATANGFTFHEYRSDVLFRQICRALGLFLDRRTWKQLQRSGMDRDWSWERSAKEYMAVYQRAVQKHRHSW